MVWRISPMRAPSLAAGRSSGAGRSQNPAMRLAAASRRRSRMRPRWRTTSRTPLRRTGAVLRSLTGSCAAVPSWRARQQAASKGKHVGNLVGLQPGETVRTMLAVRNLEQESKYIFFATRNGLVKKTELKDFSHVRANGIFAISIEQGDELVSARVTDGQQIIFLATHEGQAIRFGEEGVRPMGRQAYG